MIHDADTDTPGALWLDRAIRDVQSIPEDCRLMPGSANHAIRLLRSIEADHLPDAEVHSERRCVVVAWEFGRRRLAMLVPGPDHYRLRYSEDGHPRPVRTIRVARVEELRRYVAWLCPTANTRFVGAYLLKGE